jgi:hypothetical protein
MTLLACLQARFAMQTMKLTLHTRVQKTKQTNINKVNLQLYLAETMS